MQRVFSSLTNEPLVYSSRDSAGGETQGAQLQTRLLETEEAEEKKKGAAEDLQRKAPDFCHCPAGVLPD